MHTRLFALALCTAITCTPVVTWAQPADAGAVTAPESEPAPPPEVAPPEVNVGEAASGFVQAIQAGRWVAAFGFAFMLIGAVLRRVGGLVAPNWAGSRTGGLVLGAGAAGLIALGGGLTSGVGWLDALLGAIGLAGTAAGIWSVMPAKAKQLGKPKSA
jgi:hypothetical protein